MRNNKKRDLLLNINYLPVLNPDIVTGVSLMTLFVFLNVNFGMTTMLLSHLVFDIPYVILSVLPKLKQLPANIEDAALDLGATPWYALRKIVLPQIKPGIISGALMAFTLITRWQMATGFARTVSIWWRHPLQMPLPWAWI